MPSQNLSAEDKRQLVSLEHIMENPNFRDIYDYVKAMEKAIEQGDEELISLFYTKIPSLVVQMFRVLPPVDKIDQTILLEISQSKILPETITKAARICIR